MEHNEQNNIAIAELKKDISYLKKSIDRFDRNLIDLIASLNLDKENNKKWLQELYVSRVELNPVLKMYNRLSQMGIGILIALGGIGLCIFDFLKDKLLK